MKPIEMETTLGTSVDWGKLDPIIPPHMDSSFDLGSVSYEFTVTATLAHRDLDSFAAWHRDAEDNVQVILVRVEIPPSEVPAYLRRLADLWEKQL